MLIPLEKDYLTWATTYNIRIKTGICPKCQRRIITNIPFAMGGYRGLKSEDHGCGEKYTRKIAVPFSRDEKYYWSSVASKL